MAHERAFVHVERLEVFTGYGQLLEAYIEAYQVRSLEGIAEEGLVTQPNHPADDELYWSLHGRLSSFKAECKSVF
ncbi:YggS family pyridoxal phosphate enzyme [Sesbania bispinosa]|nr:YggS family pyridoxal phosphate enzyme [Sesbania bispinosa]